jgi:hypothetical protein
VAAVEEGAVFIPFLGELDNILYIEQERVAGLDNTAPDGGRRLQIPPNGNRHHFAKTTIRVLEMERRHRPVPGTARDGSLSFRRERVLAHHDLLLTERFARASFA